MCNILHCKLAPNIFTKLCKYFANFPGLLISHQTLTLVKLIIGCFYFYLYFTGDTSLLNTKLGSRKSTFQLNLYSKRCVRSKTARTIINQFNSKPGNFIFFNSFPQEVICEWPQYLERSNGFPQSIFTTHTLGDSRICQGGFIYPVLLYIIL